tara:strand:+ start:35 stop:313 length:279 start_codon:yes stop_codon:yes gene_type:complete
MALDDRSDQVVTKYVRRQFPELEDGIRRYIQDELQRIEQSISTITSASIQVADQAPTNPVRGMVRYAVSGWDPLGDGSTGLMVYNGNAWVAV